MALIQSNRPPLPGPNATHDELRQAMADLIFWATTHHLGALLRNGATTAEIFRLRQLASHCKDEPLRRDYFVELDQLLPVLDKWNLSF